MQISLYKNDLPDDFSLQGDLAIDTETMGLNTHRDRLCVLQFSNGDGHCYLVQFTGESYQAPNLKKLLTNRQTTKIFHYARFDLAVIKHYLGYDLENIFCTKIASRLVRTYSSYHGLKDLCKEILGINISKGPQCSNWSKEDLSPQQQEYAAGDVLYLHALRDYLQTELVKLGRKNLAADICNFLPVRANLDLQGWQETDIFTHS